MAAVLRAALALLLIAAATPPRPAPPPRPTRPPAPAPVPAPQAGDTAALCRSATAAPKEAAEACQTLGYTYQMAEINGGDFTTALRFHDRACKLGLGAGCASAGMLYSTGEVGASGDPPRPDHARALAYNKRACELDATECTGYGLAYDLGEGVKKDLTAALGIYYRGCQASDGQACAFAAKVYQEQRGNPRTITQLYLRACAADYTDGCLEASKRTAAGLGTPADKAAAKALADKACKLDKRTCVAGKGK